MNDNRSLGCDRESIGGSGAVWLVGSTPIDGSRPSQHALSQEQRQTVAVLRLGHFPGADAAHSFVVLENRRGVEQRTDRLA